MTRTHAWAGLVRFRPRPVVCSLVCCLATHGCRERSEVRRDPAVAIDAAVDGSDARAAVTRAADAPTQLHCLEWLSDPRASSEKPFPHVVDPGQALAIARSWAGRHYPKVSVGIALENVWCPAAVCDDECWFAIRLDDSKATTTSPLLEWIAVDARTGKVAVRDYADAGAWTLTP